MGADVVYATGRYGISKLSEAQQNELASTLAISAQRGPAAGTPVKRPRICLFQPWSGSMDEGWTRWVLEQYGFEYISLHPADFKSPLTGKVDVIVIADDARVPMEGAAGRGGGR